MSTLQSGKALYATFNNINVPAFDDFEAYLEDGLERVHVFAFGPNSANSVPVTNEWYTTSEGDQPQGLDTNGSSSTDEWADFFGELVEQDVQVGFVFGGQDLTTYLGDMIDNLNGNSTDFNDFLETLSFYNVSFIEFDIESSWTALGESDGGAFQNNFELFAKNMASKGIPVIIGARSPIGTVDGVPSGAPSYLDESFVDQNGVFFNVYTYAVNEYATVVAGTAWLPEDTSGVPESNILFAITSNDEEPSDPTYISYSDFVAAWPQCDLLSAINGDGYAGVAVFIWWKDESDYENAESLFTSFEVTG